MKTMCLVCFFVALFTPALAAQELDGSAFDLAARHVDKMVREKQGKGYREVA